MILVADNLQITNPALSCAVDAENPRPICELAFQCQAAGAQILDVNSGPLGRDAARKMAFFAEAVQSVSDLPLCIDTTNPVAMEAGLATAKCRPILNGISLEPSKLANMLPLVKRRDSDIVCFLLKEDGHVADDAASRLDLALRLAAILQSEGVGLDQLIFDPLVAPLIWDDGPIQARAVIETIRLLPEVFGQPVRSMVGLSNLTTGPVPPKKRVAMEIVFLSMLAEAGLTHILLNILRHETVIAARASQALLQNGVFSWEF